MHCNSRTLLAALALVGLAAPAARASSSRCSAADRDALLVGTIALGVQLRTHSNPKVVRCFEISSVWAAPTEEPREVSDRVVARVRRIVRPHHVATRTGSVPKAAEECDRWEEITVGEPRCTGNVASVPLQGEHCSPVFERVGRHWEGRPQPCE